jgi:hypothetical protein
VSCVRSLEGGWPILPGLHIMRTPRAALRLPGFGLSLLVLLLLDFTASGAAANSTGMPSRAALFVGGLVTEIMNDRARMIQASVFIVALGIALLWWRK